MLKNGYKSPSIDILHCEMVRNINWHFNNLPAPFWRFYWNENNGGYIIFDNQTIKLLPQHYYLITPDTKILVRSENKISQLYIHFRASVPFERGQAGVYSFIISDEVKKRIELLTTELNKNEMKESTLELTIDATILMLHALKNFPSEKLLGYYYDSKMIAVEAYMDTNLSGDLTNDNLANIAHMNKNTLIRHFKKFSGLTPQIYLQRKRIEHACVLLQFTDRTIEEIALRTGFCDRHYFSRIFRQWRGIGPSSYRKHNS
jgi:AraC-like DNA-binding protein